MTTKITKLLFTILLLTSSTAQAIWMQCYNTKITVHDPYFGTIDYYNTSCEWVYDDSDLRFDIYTGTPSGMGSNGTSTSYSEVLCEGNPVLIASGKKFQHEVDFASNNSSLMIERFYHQSQTHSGIFGEKWLSNFDYHLNITKDENDQAKFAQFIRPNGSTIELFYLQQTGRWYELNGKGTLFSQAENGTWVYQGDNGVIENYDATGRMTMLKPSAGKSIFFHYENNKLSRVINQSGQVLSLEYNEQQQVSKITTPTLSEYHYDYHSTGLLAEVLSPSNTKRNYGYTDERHPDALTEIKINDKTYAKWIYDAQGRALSSEHAGGVDKTQFSYNDDSTTVTSPLGKQTTYHFEQINGKKLPTYIEGHEAGSCVADNQNYNYDEYGFKDQITDWQGNITDYDHNSRGLITQITKASNTPLAQTTTTQWHPIMPLPLKITTPTLITTFSYDENHRLRQKQISSQLTDVVKTWQYQYTLHPNGLVKTHTIDGPLPGDSDLMISTFDQHENVISTQNALGHQQTFGDYDAMGNPGYKVDENGLETQFTYDSKGRLITQTVITHPTNEEENLQQQVSYFSYNAFDQLTQAITPDGNKTTFEYDDAYRKTKTTNALNQSIALTLDAAGNTTTSTHIADQQAWQFNDCDNQQSDCSSEQPIAEILTYFSQSNDFDALSRVTNTTVSGKLQGQYQYNPSGQMTSYTDGNGKSQYYQYDALGRKTSITDHEQNTTYLQYNDQNKVTQITDARGNKTTYQYNAFGQKTSQNSPDSGVKTYQYNVAGLLTLITDANGNNLSFEYDLLGRIVNKSANNELIAQWQYDTCNNGIGRLCQLTDNLSTTHYSYKHNGSLHKKTVSLAGQNYKFTYQYDQNQRLKSIKYPSGLKIKYKRNAIGQVTKVSAAGNTLLTDIQYLPFGNAKAWTFGNGQQRVIQYDSQQQIDRILATGVQNLDYERDLSGNITAISNIKYGIDNHYGYDSLNRLTRIGSTGGSSESSTNNNSEAQIYQFDSLGNRLSNTNHNESYQIDESSNRLLAVNSHTDNRVFEYDNNGNVISDLGNNHNRQFSYNSSNRMESITVDGQTIHYQYNSKDQRIAKTLANDDTIYYLYGANGKLLAEVQNDQISKQYIYMMNNELIAFYQHQQMYYVFTDHQGRPEIVTDEQTNTRWQAINKAFDRQVILNDIELNIGFPGQYWDSEKHSWYNGHRDYDATLGRYLQSDPIGVRGGINTYLYGNANTLMFTDEMGLQPVGGIGNDDIPPPQPDPCNISTAGINMLKFFEDSGGPHLTSYLDSALIPTIGWGHKILPGEDFSGGITLAEATALLVQDMQIAMTAVNDLITFDMTQSEFDALVSLVFNIGVSAFANSQTLVELNNQNWSQAMHEWSEWRMAGGVVNDGLAVRRAREINLFLEGKYP